MADWASNTIEVLSFLVPGFVAAAVYYGLTSAPKPNTFERLIQALIFTVIIQTLTDLGTLYGPFGAEPWRTLAPLGTIIFAAILGFAFALLVNTDVLHGLLRRWGITRETAYPTEWYGVFASYPGCFVVLHLRGQRRLFGWPRQWPGRQEEALFVIDGPEWLKGDERIPAGAALVVEADDVEMVEFVPPLPEDTA